MGVEVGLEANPPNPLFKKTNFDFLGGNLENLGKLELVDYFFYQQKLTEKTHEEVAGDGLNGQQDDDGQPVKDVVHGRGREGKPELVSIADLKHLTFTIEIKQSLV